MPIVLHANCPHANSPHANSPHANSPDANSPHAKLLYPHREFSFIVTKENEFYDIIRQLHEC